MIRKTMIAVTLALIIGAMASAQTSTQTEQVHVDQQNMLLRNAAESFSNKDYTASFAHYLQVAKWGHKQAQYAVALMLLHGEGVEEDVLEAYAWLTVAAESRETEWVRLHQQIEAVLPEHAKDTAKQVAAIYVQRYGNSTMGIRCHKVRMTGSNFRRTECRRQGVNDLVILGRDAGPVQSQEARSEDRNVFEVPVYNTPVFAGGHG